MDVVALVALRGGVEDEAPHLATGLGITIYEAAVMLRAPMPVIVLRTDDRSRTIDLLAKLRSRGHDAIACELSAVTSSEDMFRPRSFRFEDSDLVGVTSGDERRCPLAGILAMIRANHVTRVENTVATEGRKLSIGRAAMSGGLLLTKKSTQESLRVSDEREPVLYLFGADGSPWLLSSSELRYEGLGANLRRSKAENFEVLLKTLRDLAPWAPFDLRLLSVRPSPALIASGSKHLSTSSAGPLDVLAHIVALSHRRTSRRP